MDPITILIFIILFLLSGFFSGTELALMSLPSHKIDALVKECKFGSKELRYIKDRSDKLLITILIGNNLVNTFTAAFATVIATTLAKDSGMEASLAIGLATGIITLLLLIFGEIAPKSFATKNSESIALSVSKFYKFLMFLLTPIVFLLEKLIQVFTGKTKQEQVSESEVEAFIDMGKNTGGLEYKQHKQLKNVLEFGEIMVEEIMTPRVKLEALKDDTTVEEALDFYLKHTHSRIPVYNETIDNITHILTVRDLITVENKNIQLSDLDLIKPMKVPLNQPIDKLLEDFQKNHKVMTVVLDEYGGVAGIATLEDVIEEIFGEIRDETDKEIEEIQNKGTNIYEVDSDIRIEEAVSLFNFECTDLGWSEDKYDGETLSYVLTDILERFP
ncbi:MAG: hemolysin family protein [Candidatus Gracilibacteria bacterium]|nr:hemolysin family protein [Candidatus Gracilibacteria bacterium]